ncbi:MAG: GAF domain-containing sensor histidine kinase [Vicinamibacteraceae bacterium]
MPVDSSTASPNEEALARDVALVSRIDVVPALLDVVAHVTGMGFTAIARVTDDRWIACAVHDEIAFGMTPGGELPVATTICNEIRDCGRLVAIDHVDEDPVYRDHHTPARYGFQSYLSVPIWRHDGRFFGTLCAIDPRPHRVSDAQTVGMFTLFANLISLHMDAQEKLGLAETALSDEQARSQLQEQFIAVLGHDLRSPLNAVRTGARFMIEKGGVDADVRRSAEIIDRGARRMAGLIDDVLDFARGRLGGGLDVQPVTTTALPETIAHAVAEVQTAWPDRPIESTLRFDGPVRCDRRRIAQLLTNLLVNAFTHGDSGGAVRVTAIGSGGGLDLSVSNTGQPIPEATRRRLFLPFTRAEDRPERAGLGLGLYIACEIAKAHGGRLDVASDDVETRFTFHIPAPVAPA